MSVPQRKKVTNGEISGSRRFQIAQMSRQIAANPPLAVRYTKAAVNKGIRERMETLFDYASALELSTFLSDDHAEAVAAAVERRPPHFTGH